MTRRVVISTPAGGDYAGDIDLRHFASDATADARVPRARQWLCCAHLLVVGVDHGVTDEMLLDVQEARRCGVPVQWVCLWPRGWESLYREGDLAIGLTVGLPSGKVDT